MRYIFVYMIITPSMVLSAPIKCFYRILPKITKENQADKWYVHNEIDIVHYILEAWLQVYLKQLAYLTVYCWL